MEPRIQYAKTSDGVSIAFSTAGDGPALVRLQNPPFSHLQLQWPFHRTYYQRLMTRWMIVRFDPRGTGLSDRKADDFVLGARVSDLEAVVDHLGLRSVALHGVGFAGQVAIAYAAGHAARVNHLILDDAFARGADYLNVPQNRALRELLAGDWQAFTENVAWVSGLGREAARLAAQQTQACVTEDTAKRMLTEMVGTDVSGLLPLVRAPTLVLQHSQAKTMTIDMAKHLAAGIPNARLVVIEGLHQDDVQRLMRAIEAFVNGEPEVLGPTESAGGPKATDSATAVILFADIADSTALTERLGDAAFREKARALDGALRSAIRDHDGTPIEGKLLGDGVLATFASAKDAIEGALACGEEGSHAGLPLHLGVHAGDVIREEGNVFGGAVTIASRISDLAPPGEVLVSQTVRDLARTSAGVSFEDRGERELKGVGEPVRVFAVASE